METNQNELNLFTTAAATLKNKKKEERINVKQQMVVTFL